MDSAVSCPACGQAQIKVFFERLQVPVHQNLLYETEAAAQNTVRGDIRLGYCPECGFVSNTSFDPRLLNYSEHYDNTQCFSPSFNDYMLQLAATLIDRYDLRNKHIIEIGCGKGDFIKLLCRLGPNEGLGFDPSYLGDTARIVDHVRFVKDFYTEKYADYPGDFYCSRHVIEHVPQPAQMIETLRIAIGRRANCSIFFETPDFNWILRNLVYWDIFYEHCSLFTPGSLARLYASKGFDTTHLTTVFGGQYMWAEAVPSVRQEGNIQTRVDEVDELIANIDYFSTHYHRKMEENRALIQEIAQSGKRAVIWGAGAKGVTYLNSMGIAPRVIPYVVDINPRKQGKFMAGTGQEIVAPTFLSSFNPAIILVMNPNYAEEIRTDISNLGLSPEIILL
jgi:SAM-dependent methyltransferase